MPDPVDVGCLAKGCWPRCVAKRTQRSAFAPSRGYGGDASEVYDLDMALAYGSGTEHIWHQQPSPNRWTYTCLQLASDCYSMFFSFPPGRLAMWWPVGGEPLLKLHLSPLVGTY